MHNKLNDILKELPVLCSKQINSEEEKKEPKEVPNDFLVSNRETYIINAEGVEVLKPYKKKPCHCGSQKWYKKCCRAKDIERMKMITETI